MSEGIQVTGINYTYYPMNGTIHITWIRYSFQLNGRSTTSEGTTIFEKVMMFDCVHKDENIFGLV
ncbi:MAG TPA: hypothetical protein VIK42_02010 [Bacteroidales bacterium]